MGKVIGILSLKGGVGKTSIVVSLGGALASLGKKVLLVDANFSSPNLGLHLNILNPETTIHHVMANDSNISEAIHENDVFDVIPASSYFKRQISPLRLKYKLSQLKRKYDIILIDSSPALNEETLAAMIASDEILIVTTPDYPTISTTLKAVKIAKQRGTTISGIILNKVYNRNFEIPIEDIEKTIEVPVMAVIPYDINHLKALSKFTPSTHHKPWSSGSREYKKLAATLIGEKYHPFRIGNFFRITPKRQDVNREIYYQRAFET